MCGICGFVGFGAVLSVYEGLLDLEYRGYDSVGIAYLHGGKTTVFKQKGRVSVLKNAIQHSPVDALIAIGHTRWATHGAPNDLNAHPHSSGTVSVVHNGIIENYAELQAFLRQQGYCFVSETDSEVIAHLLHFYYYGECCENLQTALSMTIGKLCGSYAICAVVSGKNQLAVAKKGSPVVLGMRMESSDEQVRKELLENGKKYKKHLKHSCESDTRNSDISHFKNTQKENADNEKKHQEHHKSCDGKSNLNLSEKHKEHYKSRDERNSLNLCEEHQEHHKSCDNKNNLNLGEKHKECPSKNVYGVASDAAALCRHVDKVARLPDDCTAIIDYRGIAVFDLKNREIALNFGQVGEDNRVDKGGYDSYMEKEINESPDAVFYTAYSLLCAQDKNDDCSQNNSFYSQNLMPSSKPRTNRQSEPSMSKARSTPNNQTESGVSDEYYTPNNQTESGVSDECYTPNNQTESGISAECYTPNNQTESGISDECYTPNNQTEFSADEKCYTINNQGCQAKLKTNQQAELDSAVKLLKNAKKTVLVGCGTAHHSALMGRHFLLQYARQDAFVETAGEFRYSNPILDGDDVVIAVSQSGETADTIEAARLAKSRGACVIVVTNVPDSTLTTIGDCVLTTLCGREIGVAATKSYSGQLTVFLCLALSLAYAKCLKAAPNIGQFSLLRNKMQALCTDKRIELLARMVSESKKVFFVGRSRDYPLACEGSLKLKEITYMHSEGYAAGELKHGTIALIDSTSLVIALITDKATAAKTYNAVCETASRGAKTAVITCFAEYVGKGADFDLLLPDIDEELVPLIAALPLQLLAYQASKLLETDADKPRNLAKSVTVE